MLAISSTLGTPPQNLLDDLRNVDLAGLLGNQTGPTLVDSLVHDA